MTLPTFQKGTFASDNWRMVIEFSSLIISLSNASSRFLKRLLNRTDSFNILEMHCVIE